MIVFLLLGRRHVFVQYLICSRSTFAVVVRPPRHDEKFHPVRRVKIPRTLYVAAVGILSRRESPTFARCWTAWDASFPLGLTVNHTPALYPVFNTVSKWQILTMTAITVQ